MSCINALTHADHVLKLWHALCTANAAICCSGLPDAWVGDAKTTFAKGAFSLQGRFPPVVKNAFLVKGLFSDSIPMMLQQQKEWVSVGRKELFDPAPLSYIHIGRSHHCDAAHWQHLLQPSCLHVMHAQRLLT